MLPVVMTGAEHAVVFLSDAVEVEGTHLEVERWLRRSGGDLLVPLAGEATAWGEELLMTVGPSVGERVLGVPVKVRLGACWTRDGSIAIPIRWEAALFESLFPVLDGTLVVTSLDETRCRLAIEASYRPPLERLGSLIDRVLLHRVAESTVHDFLRRVGLTLSAWCARCQNE
ncbi:MAG: hypothetical protein M0Z40_07250 [Actinomycetota bacterium]|nr:hypothetical protein [Actinomycetota bacterium]MDA8315155.1 hypothetical protein [Actinomycetota bacterium]